MKKIIFVLFMGLFLFFIPTVVNAQRGCCSHHGGVSGCSSGGRQVCRDGTLSPSCTCTPVTQQSTSNSNSGSTSSANSSSSSSNYRSTNTSSNSSISNMDKNEDSKESGGGGFSSLLLFLALIGGIGLFGKKDKR